MKIINSDLKEGQSVFANFMSAKGKESFYSEFGFSERPNESMGCDMSQWIRRINQT
ncbi:hypothetical protein KTC96_11195 [Clostridium estertheticum]|uniref:hypothetical protein n=1 Tax=Clostridium estertheticum TaxID=238834 RepID=UPI001C7D39D2|nr:hypothetical protein [Clostridium estertheticum]MBX4261692.1 hypothetical protein [Clostridium estertheticum]WLC68596.1 hypothetical protein KTC96_11195 [Clostridium estertheticum]